MKIMETKTDLLDQDTKDLQQLGYVQELFRGMGGFSNFAVSFSVISILTGATQLYGYGLQHGGPLQMSLGWILVSIFTMTVALSMAELASSYPTAGALYHWSSFLGGRTLGWFTACFNTLGQFAILAGIDYGLSQFIISLGGLPNTTLVTVTIYIALLGSHAILNHFGIRIVSWLNDFSAIYHVAVVFLMLGLLWSKGFLQRPSFLFQFTQGDGFKPSYSFLVGLLLAQWTLTGYDASAHVTEETHDPRRKAPWGIFLAVAISVVMGFIMLASITLSISDLPSALNFGDDAFSKIMTGRLGVQTGKLIVGLVAGAMWLCGLATMTSASRMVYAFARDGGLPYSKFWAQISQSHRTPSHAIWGLSLFATVLVVSVKLYSAVVSIATISLYVSYGLPILARFFYRIKNGMDEKGPWNLGPFSTIVSLIAMTWIGFIVVVFILPPNDQAGLVMSSIAILLALIWTFNVKNKFLGPKFHLRK
jgi:amino acid transporter